MTSLFPPGAGGGDPKGPVREPLHPDERDRHRYAPRPPSERGTGPDEPRGIGVFRLAGCGWAVTIALFLIVAVVVVIGMVVNDPARNPAPSGYPAAVCTAFSALSDGTSALERGVEGQASDAQAAAAEVERHIATANDALQGLPEWGPGRRLEELLGSQIITLTNGAAALPDGTAGEDLELALEADALGRELLSDGRYGFTCSA